MIREEIEASLSSLSVPPPTKRVRRSRIEESDSEEGFLEDSPSESIPPMEDTRKYFFASADLGQLLTAVRHTMQVEEQTPQQPSLQDTLFRGLIPQPKPSFPVNDILKQLILTEWKQAEHKFFLPKEFKERMVFTPEDIEFLDTVPKVDLAVARVSKKAALPFEDISQLRDPLDSRVDSAMKKAWESAALTMKTNITATSVARSMTLWLDQLQALVSQRGSREDISNCLPLLQQATGFLADASMESVRFGARSAALSNTARRAVWVKAWTGDNASKNRLCSLPFQGHRIFGPSLDTLLEKASDKSQGLPAERPVKRPSSSYPPPFVPPRTYRGKGKTRRWSYPKGGKGENPPIGIRQVGGRLRGFANRWNEITSNPWALRLVSEGYRIELSAPPPRRFMVTPCQSPASARALQSGVRDLLSLGAIIPVPSEERFKGCYSPLFLIKKPNGAYRVIINLKYLNKSIAYRRFKMESVRSAIPLITPDSVMATVDLKDAYYHIPIHSDSQQFLRFALVIEGSVSHYQFACLPFGISSAPRVFSKLVLEMVAALRTDKVLIVPYLDDFLLIAGSPSELQHRVNLTLHLFESLGWINNFDKSNLQPEQRKKFLGVILDSHHQCSSLPLEKQKTIQDESRALSLASQVSLRRGMRVLGLITACIGVVPWAQLHGRTLQDFILSNWDKSPASLDQEVTLTHKVRSSLGW
ncbi:uncharacterized protein [Eleutherodactylus coqui]|uniref:uncharacterized protein n=1 Tax=Eleutherodactylus coqui TaxID=57060 RepID=UPI0034620E62